MLARNKATIVTVACLACAGGKLATQNASNAAPPPPRETALPDRLDGQIGQRLTLGPSERALARSPHVTLTRRRYGSSQVSMVTTDAIREIHPPAVCLKAVGLEVVRRRHESSSAGCLIHLWVRNPEDGTMSHMVHTYPGANGLGTCDFWRRTGSAALSRLLGRRKRWASLQVMDRDADRARQVITLLLRLLGDRDASGQRNSS